MEDTDDAIDDLLTEGLRDVYPAPSAFDTVLKLIALSAPPLDHKAMDRASDRVLAILSKNSCGVLPWREVAGALRELSSDSAEAPTAEQTPFPFDVAAAESRPDHDQHTWAWHGPDLQRRAWERVNAHMSDDAQHDQLYELATYLAVATFRRACETFDPSLEFTFDGWVDSVMLFELRRATP